MAGCTSSVAQNRSAYCIFPSCLQFILVFHYLRRFKVCLLSCCVVSGRSPCGSLKKKKKKQGMCVLGGEVFYCQLPRNMLAKSPTVMEDTATAHTCCSISLTHMCIHTEQRTCMFSRSYKMHWGKGNDNGYNLANDWVECEWDFFFHLHMEHFVGLVVEHHRHQVGKD